MHYMLQNLNKLSELHWWSMAFKFYFSLPPLVSLVNGHCSLWHLWSVTHTASHQELQWQQKDSASGSLRAFLLALDRKQQTYPPYAPQPKNKLHAISLLPLDSYYSWIFSLWFPSHPLRSLIPRLSQGSTLTPGSLSWALTPMPVRGTGSTWRTISGTILFLAVSGSSSSTNSRPKCWRGTKTYFCSPGNQLLPGREEHPINVSWIRF